MRASIALLASVLLGPCGSSSGDAPQPAPAVTASAAATAVPAATAVAAATVAPVAPVAAAVPPHAIPAAGPCATLAQKCKKCPPGVTQMACSGALTAGALDPSACTNALADKDITAQCGGAPPAASVAPTASGVAPVAPTASAAPAGAGPCVELAAKCAKCPAGIVKFACMGAMTAGNVNPTACTNALNDKDIKAQCN